MTMEDIFCVGDQIGGYCNGYFGRNDYENKICVMVTRKYAVFQYEDDTAEVLNWDDRFELMQKDGSIAQWFEDYNKEYY